MAPDSDESPVIDDPALDGADWLFQRDGQVYGPVDGHRLASLLYRGDLLGGTLVSSGDGRWQPLERVPAFLVHVRKAEAAQRVEQEVTGRRLLQARKARTRTAGWVVAALLVVAGAGAVAFLLGRSRVERSPLLDGFGAGIAIVAPARITAASRAVSDEIEVALDAGGRAARPAGQARAVAPRPGDLAGASGAPGAGPDRKSVV